jgi:EAL domain-containing protein (putative c-di-GMP-specific phosphodiesterase class I)
MILLGHSIGKRVVFEGVETEPQAMLLQSLGCDLLQGYRFGRPMAMADLLAQFPDLGPLAARGTARG